MRFSVLLASRREINKHHPCVLFAEPVRLCSTSRLVRCDRAWDIILILLCFVLIHVFIAFAQRVYPCVRFIRFWKAKHHHGQCAYNDGYSVLPGCALLLRQFYRREYGKDYIRRSTSSSTLSIGTYFGRTQPRLTLAIAVISPYISRGDLPPRDLAAWKPIMVSIVRARAW